MLTNLVASTIFVVIGLTIVQYWITRRDARKLSVTVEVAYNSIARAPLGQRRMMWFLLHGGELVEDLDFKLSVEQVNTVKEIIDGHKLDQVSEGRVRNALVEAPPLYERLSTLAADPKWVQLAYDALRSTVAGFRVIIARWAGLLVTTDQTARALRELSEQAEELTEVFVRLLPLVRANGGKLSETELIDLYLHWRKSFTNAVRLDEALIQLGGERGDRWTTDGRRLLQKNDFAALERLAVTGNALRVYTGKGLADLVS